MKYTVLMISLLLLFAGCGGDAARRSGQLQVSTTLFVLYDFARQIGGEDVVVSLMIPPGVEAHSFEPSPRAIDDLKKENVFIFGGAAMDPWAEPILGILSSSKVLVVDAAADVPLLDVQGHTTEDDDAHADPHYWLDPARAAIVAETIGAAFVAADPDQAAQYRVRTDSLKLKLSALDKKIRTTLSTRKGSTVIFAGHNMFGYFASRYGLEFLSPYTGFSPEAEPQARRLVELEQTMKEKSLTVVYHEENIDPRAAQAIGEATGARMVMLHGAHNVTQEELDSGVTYLSIIEDNLAKLQKDPGLFF